MRAVDTSLPMATRQCLAKKRRDYVFHPLQFRKSALPYYTQIRPLRLGSPVRSDAGAGRVCRGGPSPIVMARQADAAGVTMEAKDIWARAPARLIEAEARAPRMQTFSCGRLSPARIASMRPRRARLGCRAGVVVFHHHAGASMRVAGPSVVLTSHSVSFVSGKIFPQHW